MVIDQALVVGQEWGGGSLAWNVDQKRHEFQLYDITDTLRCRLVYNVGLSGLCFDFFFKFWDIKNWHIDLHVEYILHTIFDLCTLKYMYLRTLFCDHATSSFRAVPHLRCIHVWWMWKMWTMQSCGEGASEPPSPTTPPWGWACWYTHVGVLHWWTPNNGGAGGGGGGGGVYATSWSCPFPFLVASLLFFLFDMTLLGTLFLLLIICWNANMDLSLESSEIFREIQHGWSYYSCGELVLALSSVIYLCWHYLVLLIFIVQFAFLPLISFFLLTSGCKLSTSNFQIIHFEEKAVLP